MASLTATNLMLSLDLAAASCRSQYLSSKIPQPLYRVMLSIEGIIDR
ncbi:hypothetical protein A1F99_056680 [Pyrenophora tritici-repentis]|nr:hypothetical protein A1F99_056680 [Pyrenophora tritici-repentis]